MSLYGNADAAFLQGSLGAIFDEARANGSATLRGRPEGGCLLVDQTSEVLGPVVVAPIGTPFGELGVGEGHRLVMVIDDSDNYFVVYRGDGERADILVEERSDPDGVAPAHFVLGDPEALHYLGHDSVEEQDGGILEYGPEGGARDAARDVHVDEDVGCVRELGLAVAGDRYHAGTDLPGDSRGLADGGSVAGVGDEQREVVLADDGGGHLSDEMHVEPQLDQPHGEELPDQPGSAGTVDERLGAVDDGLDEFVAAVGVH